MPLEVLVKVPVEVLVEVPMDALAKVAAEVAAERLAEVAVELASVPLIAAVRLLRMVPSASPVAVGVAVAGMLVGMVGELAGSLVRVAVLLTAVEDPSPINALMMLSSVEEVETGVEVEVTVLVAVLDALTDPLVVALSVLASATVVPTGVVLFAVEGAVVLAPLRRLEASATTEDNPLLTSSTMLPEVDDGVETEVEVGVAEAVFTVAAVLVVAVVSSVVF